MAVRRTLKQKQKAQLQRAQNLTYSLPKVETKKRSLLSKSEPAPAPTPHMGPSLHEIFGYAPVLLWRDILKTLLTTLIVVGVLLALKYVPYFQAS